MQLTCIMTGDILNMIITAISTVILVLINIAEIVIAVEITGNATGGV